jgi:hypothetical protein
MIAAPRFARLGVLNATNTLAGRSIAVSICLVHFQIVLILPPQRTLHKPFLAFPQITCLNVADESAITPHLPVARRRICDHGESALFLSGAVNAIASHPRHPAIAAAMIKNTNATPQITTI